MHKKTKKSVIAFSILALFTGVMITGIFIVFDRFSRIPEFGHQKDCGVVEYPAIREASGIAASRRNGKVLWTHNDSGHGPVLYAMNDQGRHLGLFRIAGAQARDWEDIAIGPGPQDGKDYIYIGDIGDNPRRRAYVTIYRVLEPEVSSSQKPVKVRLRDVEEIRLKLPDKPRDSEALMVDPLNKDIYIVTKRERKVAVYRSEYPQSTGEKINEFQSVARLNLTDVVAADISPSGLEVLIKTYSGVYYWRRDPDLSFAEMFKTRPVALPYILEPQGEAICWSADGNGYFTLSEELARVPAHLYFYPKVKSDYVEMNRTKQSATSELLKYRINFALHKAWKLSYILSTKFL